MLLFPLECGTGFAGEGGGGGVDVVVAVDVQANLEAGLKRWVETKSALGTLALGFSGLVEGCPCLLPVKNTGASWLISSHSCFDRSRGPRTSKEPSYVLSTDFLYINTRLVKKSHLPSITGSAICFPRPRSSFEHQIAKSQGRHSPSHPLIAKVGSNLKHNGVVRTVLLDRKLASPYCAGTSRQFKPTDDAKKGRCSHNRKV
jgi:hypothetical protein